MPETTPKTTQDAVPRRSDYGRGAYRRAIVLTASEGNARGELVDDFHHFVASIEHRRGMVTAVRGESVRVPWTTCPGSVEPLRRLVGAALDADLERVAAHTDARAQCTHLYDAACLAIAEAARQRARGADSTRRRYDVVLTDRLDGVARATLDRDGERLFDWPLEGLRVGASARAPFGGAALRGADFSAALAALARADDAHARDLVEAARVMRRAVFIGLGRQYDFERIEYASAFAPVVGAACHTFSPAQLDGARRVHGSVRDFAAPPALPS